VENRVIGNLHEVLEFGIKMQPRVTIFRGFPQKAGQQQGIRWLFRILHNLRDKIVLRYFRCRVSHRTPFDFFLAALVFFALHAQTPGASAGRIMFPCRGISVLARAVLHDKLHGLQNCKAPAAFFRSYH
jgi:hypothetical protein